MSRDRIGDRLNRALHSLLGRHGDLYLLGEDIKDPYGGAFRITRGLSSAYPQRVIGSPISEGGLIGVANGLALAGNKAIVEIMFGDFAALAFDQIFNFTAKSVAMFGARVPMPVVVRCAVGGHRGYGPTHSQSPQKHFIGIPDLSLFELSAYHDPEELLTRMLSTGLPAILFEPKSLYGAAYRGPGPLDESLLCERIDDDWVRIAPTRGTGPDFSVLAPGGTAGLAVDAACELAATGEATVQVLVPARLYPLNLEPVLEHLRGAHAIFTAEESVAGGVWGAEVAAAVHQRLWTALRRPVRCLHSRDSVIPAAPHLERTVLLQRADIIAAIREAIGAEPGRPAAAPDPDASGAGVVVPKLNNNDDTYVLLAWLVDDGVEVAPGDIIAEIETSKAVNELEVAEAGILRHEVAAGSECPPGGRVARIVASRASDPRPSPRRAPAGVRPEEAAPDALSRAQQQVAAVVTQSHQEIPDAYVVYRAGIDVVREVRDELTRAGEPGLGLLEVAVKILGDLRPEFPDCFSSLGPGTTRLRRAAAAHVGVTLDAGHGLVIPVVNQVEERTLDDVADILADYRMRALTGSFSERELTGATITISWNHEPDVVAVQPVIPPGTACALAIGGAMDEWVEDGTGGLRRRQVVHLGLAHDHRIVNGAQAIRFLAAFAGGLADRERLAKLVRETMPASGEGVIK